MHATLTKFGYPSTLVREFEHWCVLLRPQQVTLGALVLAAKSEVTQFSGLPVGAFTELALVTAACETALRSFAAYDKINYLMLMMVDPQVHFHVIPRYQTAPSFTRLLFADPGWPGMPDLKFATDVADTVRSQLQYDLQKAFATAC